MTLQSLIVEATRYARFTMKQSGFLIPIMMASTDKGIILFSPDKMSVDSFRLSVKPAHRISPGSCYRSG